MIYLATDWHLWEYSKNLGCYVKCKDYNYKLQYTKDTMQAGDLLIYLGDLTDDEFHAGEKLKGLLSDIAGDKILVRGNNDTLPDEVYKDAGFSLVADVCTMANIIFSHRPLHVGPLQINIHGHLHGHNNEHLTPQNIDVRSIDTPIVLIDQLLAGNEPDYNISIDEEFWKAVSPTHDVVSGDVVDITDLYVNHDDVPRIDESVFRADNEMDVFDFLESVEAGVAPITETRKEYLNKLSHMAESYFSSSPASEIGPIEETLEHFFGARPKTERGGMVTLYHGTPHGDLLEIKPVSLNVGTRLSKPRTSSFWSDDPDIAACMGVWSFLASVEDPEAEVSVMYIDFKTKNIHLVDTEYKRVEEFLRRRRITVTVYRATVPSRYVGKGHDPSLPEFTVDIVVKPHAKKTLKPDDIMKYLVPQSWSSMRNIVGDNVGMLVSPRKVPLMDKLIYHKDFRKTYRNMKYDMGFGEYVGRANQEKGYTPIQETLFDGFEDTGDYETDDDVSRAKQDPDYKPVYRVRFRKKVNNGVPENTPTIDETLECRLTKGFGKSITLYQGTLLDDLACHREPYRTAEQTSNDFAAYNEDSCELVECAYEIPLAQPLMAPVITEALNEYREIHIKEPNFIEEAAGRRATVNVNAGQFDKVHARQRRAKAAEDPLRESSPFEGMLKSIKVDKKKSMIIIKGIDYRKMLARIRNMYDTRRVTKIFDPEYTPWSMYLYNSEQIEKKDLKIKSLQVPLFFALELQQILYDLGDYYQLEFYSQLADDLAKKTWIGNVNKPVTAKEIKLNKIKNLFTIKPLDYQAAYVAEYFSITRRFNLDGHILTFKPGHGKTFTATMIAEAAPDVDQIVVVCPNTLKENWANEIKGYYKKYANNENAWKNDVYVYGVSPTSVNKNNAKWIIVNQESIPKVYEFVHHDNVMIIVDECQYFRNYESGRSKNLLKLKKITNATEVLLMSGTPIHATPDEALTALLMIDPMMNLELAKIYKSAFTVNNTVIERAVNARFGIVMYDTPYDVLDLPEKKITSLKLPLKDDQKFLLNNVEHAVSEAYAKHYAELGKKAGEYKKDFIAVLNRYSNADPTENTLYLQFIENGGSYLSIHESKHDFYSQFINTHIYPNVPPTDIKRVKLVVANYVYMSAKARGLAMGEVMPPLYNEVNIRLWDDHEDQFIEAIENNLKKTLIFSPYVDVVYHIADRLKVRGVDNVCITGSVKKNRMALINKFRYTDGVDVMVATHNVAGTGLTLVEASQVFFFGVPFRSAEFDQAADRVYRIGQTSTVNIIKVLLESSVERASNITTRQNAIMEWSREMSGAYTRGARQWLDYQKGVVTETAAYDMVLDETFTHCECLRDAIDNVFLHNALVTLWVPDVNDDNEPCERAIYHGEAWRIPEEYLGYDIISIADIVDDEHIGYINVKIESHVAHSVEEATAIQRACAQYDEYNADPMFGKETMNNQWDSDYDDSFANDEVEFNESAVFSEKDIKLNLDNWKPGKHNILFVTGLSGSGKTTLSGKYVKKYRAELFELDGIFYEYDTSSAKILSRLKEEDREYAKHKMYDPVTGKQFDRWISTVIRYMHEDSKTLYVVEGLQLYSGRFDLVDLSSDPVIILGTSALKSMYRRLKRSSPGDRRADITKLYDLIKYYARENDNLDRYRSNVKKHRIAESWEDSMPTDVDGGGAPHLDGTHATLLEPTDATIGDVFADYNDPITDIDFVEAAAAPVLEKRDVIIQLNDNGSLYYMADDLKFFASWLKMLYIRAVSALNTARVDAVAIANIKAIISWLTKLIISADPNVTVVPDAQLVVNTAEKLLKLYAKRAQDIGITWTYASSLIDPIFAKMSEEISSPVIVNMALGKKAIRITMM